MLPLAKRTAEVIPKFRLDFPHTSHTNGRRQNSFFFGSSHRSQRDELKKKKILLSLQHPLSTFESVWHIVLCSLGWYHIPYELYTSLSLCVCVSALIIDHAHSHDDVHVHGGSFLYVVGALVGGHYGGLV